MQARDEYFVTEVLTAPPQKLQLMLLDAALRSAARARDLWQAGSPVEAGEAILRCQEIVTEIMAGIRPEIDKPLTSRVSAIYAFIFRCLVDAHLHSDEGKLAEAVSILEIERETWQQVCTQLAGTTSIARPHYASAQQGSAPQHAMTGGGMPGSSVPASSFSLEC